MARINKKIIGFFLTLLIFFCINLGERYFATPDEARYVEIPREMVVSGDFITPRLNGVKYFEKPPLLYWLQAVNIKLFGVQEWAMRLWIVFFAFIGCITTFFFAQKFYNQRAAFNSTIILSTAILYHILSNLIILDMQLAVLITIAMYCFYAGFHETNKLHRRLLLYGFTICCGLGVLTKGIIALAIPGPAILIWLLINKGFSNLRPLYLPTNIILFLIITVPWHLLAVIKNNDFLHKYFVVEHFLRYTTDVHMRYQPWWFFVPILLVGFLPWTVNLPQVFKDIWKNKKDPLILFLSIWVIWVFIFFSLSNSKLVPYILPLFPPLAILTSKYQKFNSNERWIFLILAIIPITIMHIFPNTFPELRTCKAGLVPYLYGLSGILLAIFLIYNHFKDLSLKIGGILLCILIHFASPHIQKPSLKNVANYLNKEQKKGEIIVAYKAYFQDLPVYTGQIVTLVDVGGELEFGIRAEDTKKWVWGMEDFLNNLKKMPMWVISREVEYNDLINNHPNLRLTKYFQENGIVVFKNH